MQGLDETPSKFITEESESPSAEGEGGVWFMPRNTRSYRTKAFTCHAGYSPP